MCPTNPLVNVQIFLRVQFCSFLERLGSHGFLLELSGRNSRPHDVYSVRNEGWGGGRGEKIGGGVGEWVAWDREGEKWVIVGLNQLIYLGI